ncbi:LysR family transcriptional regulator [Phototrophicus methaneseepsis]|uniref:LysR family transcriptional regulator n=1 Tax=Phototrophicus methaneseepsis TaxID=2710758 RepID=A0A7S8IGB4_9CHLR|nr:LysR substrate-binding domain-containing protein [Phototrophicus methaneseepsis]QPC84556.1 LysR family transcriptional regulator [Phototrophicus methaneseepsis]
MELRHLRYFVAVAEDLHFKRAAERLQISQQPLSVQIRNLEDELGVTLFERTTRSVKLTQAGYVFLQKAKETLQLAEESVRVAREAERGERGKIVVGYISTSLYNVLPLMMRTFRETSPNVEVDLQELCFPDLQQLVIEGVLDIALIATHSYNNSFIQHHELDCLTLCREPFVVVMPKNHDLARLTEVPFQMLDNLPFIQFSVEEKRQAHDEVVSFFYHHGITLNAVQEVASEQAQIGMVAAGIGISIVSESVAKSRETDVVYRRLTEPSVDVDFNLIWQRQAPTALVERFVRVAQTQAWKSQPGE